MPEGNEMFEYDRQKLKKQLMEIAEGYAKFYKTAGQVDYQERVNSLIPGQTYPKNDGFIYTDTWKTKLKREADEALQHAKDVCESFASDALREMTTAPDPRKLTYVNALKERSIIGVDEMAEAFAKYGDNWTCYQILLEIKKEQSKLNSDMHKIKPVHSIQGYKEVNEKCMATLETWFRIISSGMFQPDYVDFRLETLQSVLNTIIDSHGTNFVDINAFMNRKNGHLAVRPTYVV